MAKTLEVFFEPVDNARLSRLCGVLDENLRQIENAFDITVSRRGEHFTLTGHPAQVLRGEMALVGPRPLPVRYLPRYSPQQARRHEVRPGITGWAQVNGRNTLTWEEKFAYDVWYVDHRSLWLDAKILWLTVWQVLARRGISAEGEATMGEFYCDH